MVPGRPGASSFAAGARGLLGTAPSAPPSIPALPPHLFLLLLLLSPWEALGREGGSAGGGKTERSEGETGEGARRGPDSRDPAGPSGAAGSAHLRVPGKIRARLPPPAPLHRLGLPFIPPAPLVHRTPLPRRACAPTLSGAALLGAARPPPAPSPSLRWSLEAGGSLQAPARAVLSCGSLRFASNGPRQPPGSLCAAHCKTQAGPLGGCRDRRRRGWAHPCRLRGHPCFQAYGWLGRWSGRSARDPLRPPVAGERLFPQDTAGPQGTASYVGAAALKSERAAPGQAAVLSPSRLPAPG